MEKFNFCIIQFISQAYSNNTVTQKWLVIYYVYMSSDGLPKRDSPFWRHCTVRFTLSENHSHVADASVSIYCVRLWTKGCMELESMHTDYRFHEVGNCCSCLSWSWCRELKIVLHTVKSIHSRRALTFTACVDVTCGRLQAYKFHTGFLSTMLKNILEITA